MSNYYYETRVARSGKSYYYYTVLVCTTLKVSFNTCNSLYSKDACLTIVNNECYYDNTLGCLSAIGLLDQIPSCDSAKYSTCLKIATPGMQCKQDEATSRCVDSVMTSSDTCSDHSLVNTNTCSAIESVGCIWSENDCIDLSAPSGDSFYLCDETGLSKFACLNWTKPGFCNYNEVNKICENNITEVYNNCVDVNDSVNLLEEERQFLCKYVI